MCVEFKLPDAPSGLEELRLARQDILARLQRIPLDYYTITAKRVPPGLLRKNQVSDYRKLLLTILSCDSLQSFFRTAETGWLADTLKSYRMYEWIRFIKFKTTKEHDYQKEAFIAIMDAEQWLASARTVLEAEFTHKMLEDDDKAAREILIRRFGDNWSEKLQAIHAQAKIAKDLADEAKKTGDGTSTINFVLAGA